MLRTADTYSERRQEEERGQKAHEWCLSEESHSMCMLLH